MPINDDELFATFLEEAKEHIDILNNGLLGLEKAPEDQEIINTVFRAAHSIKGNAAMVELHEIKTLAHALENTLDALRDKTIVYSKELYDLLFEGVDTLSSMVDSVAKGEEIHIDFSDLVKLLSDAADFMGSDLVNHGEDQNEKEEKPAAKEEKSAASQNLKSVNDPEILAAFYDDTQDIILSLEQDFSDLKKSPSDMNLLNNIFRGFHSIKGGASFLNMKTMTKLADSLERLVNTIKNNKGRSESNMLDLLFEGFEFLTSMVRSAVKNNQGEINISDITDRIDAVSPDKGSVKNKKMSHEPKQKKEAVEKVLAEKQEVTDSDAAFQKSSPKEKKVEFKTQETIRVQTKKLDDTIRLLEELISTHSMSEQKLKDIKDAGKLTQKMRQEISSVLNSSAREKKVDVKSGNMIGIVAIEEKILEPNQVVDILHAQKNTGKWFGEVAVDMGYLTADESKRLINLKNEKDRISVIDPKEYKRIKDFLREIEKSVEALDQRIKNLITFSKDEHSSRSLLLEEIQDKTMKIRMLPLSSIFDTFNRTVRDISKSVGKDIVFTVTGSDTELDKKMIEKLGDPLIHMIRNSVDHAIESPDERLNAGKSAKGNVHISSGYEGNNVVINVMDDGRGISTELIRKKAVARKLFSEEQLSLMEEREILNIIFHPGFTTSDKITDLSGRGVGMDIVQKNIIRDLKGAIQINTKIGEGTTFTIRLPLTLAIMKTLIFFVSNIKFAIPVNYIKEIIKINSSEIVKVVNKTVFKKDEKIIPVVFLSNILGLEQIEIKEKDPALLILIKLGDEMLALCIDSIVSEEDRVLKQLPGHMRNISLVSGVIMSSGNELINVLHIPRLLGIAKEIETGNEKLSLENTTTGKFQSLNLLLIDDSKQVRLFEKKILEDLGYHVDLAEDGTAGIIMIKNFKYDLIITDIEMPGMDGFTFTQELRKIRNYKHVPVIVASSLEKEKFKKRAFEVGANAYIVKKDFDSSLLIETIRALAG